MPASMHQLPHAFFKCCESRRFFFQGSMSTVFRGGEDSVRLISRFESQNNAANKIKGIDCLRVLFVVTEKTHNSCRQHLC